MGEKNRDELVQALEGIVEEMCRDQRVRHLTEQKVRANNLKNYVQTIKRTDEKGGPLERLNNGALKLKSDGKRTLSKDFLEKYEEKMKRNKLLWVNLMKFEEEMSKKLASSDVSPTSAHQLEAASRQGKRNNTELVRKRFETNETRDKKKMKRENCERRKLQEYRLQNGKALFALQMQNASTLRAMAGASSACRVSYIAKNTRSSLAK